MEIITVFLLLVCGHFLADYPLQGDFLATAKNRFKPIPGVPWYQAMGAHAGIHAGMVGVITGSIALAICEFLVHARIDDSKCRGDISYNMDQFLHIFCKLVWTLILFGWIYKQN